MSWRGSGNFGPFGLHFLPGRGRERTCVLRHRVCEFGDVILYRFDDFSSCSCVVTAAARRAFGFLPSDAVSCRPTTFPAVRAVSCRPTPFPVLSCRFGRCRVVTVVLSSVLRRLVADCYKVCVCQSVSGLI